MTTLSSDYLTCGHPVQCLSSDDDSSTPFCGWCDAVGDLERDNKALRDACNNASLIVTGGTVNLTCNQIGYLAVLGGEVSLSSGCSVSSLTAFRGNIGSK